MRISVVTVSKADIVKKEAKDGIDEQRRVANYWTPFTFTFYPYSRVPCTADIDVKIDGPSKADIVKKEEKDGTDGQTDGQTDARPLNNAAALCVMYRGH